jgi:hypothetical protein
VKVFISWSGELSKELGDIFSKWIPSVLQCVKPSFTPAGVDKGSRWSSEIAKELEESRIGIIMLTRENLLQPWIMFEAGALSKELEKSRICPILFGVGNSDLVGPLAQFQATLFEEEEMRKLIRSINNVCGENKLEDSVCESVFDKWWPDLERQVSSAMGKERYKGDRKSRSDRELLEEILGLSRESASKSDSELSEYITAKYIEQLYTGVRELGRAAEEEDMAEIKAIRNRMADIMEDMLRRRIGTGIVKKEPGRLGKVLRILGDE